MYKLNPVSYNDIILIENIYGKDQHDIFIRS